MGKKKPKMGRPPLPPDERRTKPIKVRVTATEYRLLEREARRAKVSIPEVLMRPWREGTSRR